MAVNGNIILVSLLVPKRELTDAETLTAKSRVSMNVEMFGNISVLLSMLLSQDQRSSFSRLTGSFAKKKKKKIDMQNRFKFSSFPSLRDTSAKGNKLNKLVKILATEVWSVIRLFPWLSIC